MNIQILYVGFWTLTYILVIIAGYKSQNIKQVSMPYTAGILNLAWEICAVLTNPHFWGYYPWLFLDVIIAYIGYVFLDDTQKRRRYLRVIIIATLLLYILCRISMTILLISVYVIDLIMALVYLFRYHKLSPSFQISIGLTKLFGDLFAAVELFQTITEPQYAIPLRLTVAAVFVCNVIYVMLAVIRKAGIRKTIKSEFQ